MSSVQQHPNVSRQKRANKTTVLKRAIRKELADMKVSRDVPSAPPQRPSRASERKFMQTAMAGRDLTEAGADWLVQALDPYHDFNRPIAGYPDACSDDTVVVTRNYQYDLTKPAGAAGNWDFHIFTTPFDDTGALFEGSVNAAGKWTQNAGASARNLGYVTIAKADAGQPLFPNADPFVSTNFSMGRLWNFETLNRDYHFRILGFGVEVIDTTAVVNRQGTLTAYRSPCQTWDEHVTMINNAGTVTGEQVCFGMNRPPSTVAEAALYPNSVTWGAPEGCYMVATQSGILNPIGGPKYGAIFVQEHPGAGGGPALASNVAAAVANAAPALSSLDKTEINVTPGYSRSGVFVTGVANAATFTVRCRLILEIKPLFDDTLAPLASPSPPYDENALKLYAYLVSHVAVAVPVGENAGGGWWRGILRAIGKIAPALGVAVSPLFPPAAAIGTSIGAAAHLLGKNGHGRRMKGFT